MNTRTQGQVLLIGLMLIALVTTIVGTGALRSMSSTQTTKQKEESKKASNAAQGALEAGINNEDINYSDFTDVNPTGYAQSRAPKTIADKFVYNEVVPKDHQYMFYLTEYNQETNLFDTDPLKHFAGDLTVYYKNSGTTCPLLELIQINDDNQISNRTYTAPNGDCGSNSLNFPGAIAPAGGGTLDWDGQQTVFANSITINIAGSTKLLIIRPFFEGTKLGFSISDPAKNLKPQGREISSTVRTIDGAQKTEKVYQAYPQIPLSLFATVL
jgi:type II secretory pathway pseudopilin PulG